MDRMQGPRLYIVRIVLFLMVVAALAGVLSPVLVRAFMNNPALNGVIVATLLIGIVFILRHTVRLGPEVEWMRTIDENGRTRVMPNLLRPVASMSQGRDGLPTLSPVTLRSVLDGVGARLDESRELSRYLINLLIFLGLLGTFWGLINTVGAVSNVIGALDFTGNGSSAAGFASLKQGLQAPLNGMGTAFSASLFGLSGSLVLGFLDLQLGQAQTAFFRNLEDWLSGATKVQNNVPYLESGDNLSSPQYVQALVENTAEAIEKLRASLSAGDEERRAATHAIVQLGGRLDALAETQAALNAAIQRIGGTGPDETAHMLLRTANQTLTRLADDIGAGRRQTTQDIRGDLKLIARILGGASNPPPEG
jgi:hypothetical protein